MLPGSLALASRSRRFAPLRDLTQTLLDRHRTSLDRDYAAIFDCWRARQRERSASLADCLFLYLLIQELRPRCIFEIGTWVGTTATVMAEASGLDATVYTCDKNEMYDQTDRYEGVVVPMLGMRSKEATRRLREKGTRVDLVFADGRLDRETARNLSQLMHPGSIFATHDYAAGKKGVHNLDLMHWRLGWRRTCALTPPEGPDAPTTSREEATERASTPTPPPLVGLRDINRTTALLVPNTLAGAQAA